MSNKNYLTYEEFGAKGDGVADDMAAIVACHEEANRTGASVRARDDATYYIGPKPLTAVIKTSTAFGKAKFTIDDREVALADRNTYIFSVESDFEPYSIDLKTLSKDTKKLDFPHEGRAFVMVMNSNHKMFIRRSLNCNNGDAARDAFLVDADGNVLSPIDWDFDEITSATAKSIEDEPILISGGIFTTVANNAECFYNYHSRSFKVLRSNVKFEDMTHYVTGEGEQGAPYAGFITANSVANLTVENCVLTPRKIYWTPSQIPGKMVAMGSYGINIGACIDAKFIGISQTVNIRDNRYWGLFTSNFCKNLYFENCIVSRFDAHQGVSNVTLKNCCFGHQCINLIGHGEALIENCRIYGSRIADFRFDYGSIWDGNVTVNSCTLIPQHELEKIVLFTATNSGDHDFGYQCCMPRHITVDGLKIMNGKVPNSKFYLLPDYDTNFYPLPEGDTAEGKPFPYEPTHKVTVKNVSFEAGGELNITFRPELYEGLIIER